MYIHINTERVVIDVTETAKYIASNDNGKKYLTYDQSKAIAVLGTNDVIRQLARTSLIVEWDSISEVVPVMDYPEDWDRNPYTYNDGEFESYDGTAPEDNRQLTEGVSENSGGILDVAELSDENAGAIEDLAEIVDDLLARVEALEEKED